MGKILKNTMAVIGGIIFGSIVNMGIINISGSIIPPPPGADVTTTEGLKASIHLFEPKHFLFPFLAHAIGTFTGALLASFVAETNKIQFSLVIGIFFLVGGIASIFLFPAPIWFIVLDLVVAYIPFSLIAGKIVVSRLEKK